MPQRAKTLEGFLYFATVTVVGWMQRIEETSGRLVSAGFLLLIFNSGCNYSKSNLFIHSHSGNIEKMILPLSNEYSDSIYYTFYANGQLQDMYILRKRFFQGPEYHFSNKGKLLEYCMYDSGYANGMCCYYFSNGNISKTGRYKNGLESGEWIFFDSLNPGKLNHISDYFIMKNKPLLNKHLQYDSLGNPIGFYFTLKSQIQGVKNFDTLYSFTIRIVCQPKNLDKVRIIYGNLGNDFSDFSSADTVFPKNGLLLIQNINISKKSIIMGIVQYYRKLFSTERGDTITEVRPSYFLLRPTD